MGVKPAHDALHLPGRKRRHPVPPQQKHPPPVRDARPVEIGLEIRTRKIGYESPVRVRPPAPLVKVLWREMPGALPLWGKVAGVLPPPHVRGAPFTRRVAAFGDLGEG